jgi:hypothetical protein
VIKIVIDDEGEKALLPEAEKLLRRRAAEVGFSTLDWIVQLLELHAEQDDEDEPEDEGRRDFERLPKFASSVQSPVCSFGLRRRCSRCYGRTGLKRKPMLRDRTPTAMRTARARINVGPHHAPDFFGYHRDNQGSAVCEDRVRMGPRQAAGTGRGRQRPTVRRCMAPRINVVCSGAPIRCEYRQHQH